MKKLLFLYFLFAVLALSGCGTLDSSRGLNEQNEQGGDFISKNSDQPEIAQIGADIRDNSLAISRDIGAARDRIAYSHQNSVGLQNKQAAELAAREAVRNLIDTGIGSAAAALGLSAVWLFLKNLKNSKIAKTVIQGVEEFRTNSNADVSSQLRNTISEKALENRVADPVKAMVEKHTEP